MTIRPQHIGAVAVPPRHVLFINHPGRNRGIVPDCNIFGRNPVFGFGNMEGIRQDQIGRRLDEALDLLSRQVGIFTITGIVPSVIGGFQYQPGGVEHLICGAPQRGQTDSDTLAGPDDFGMRIQQVHPGAIRSVTITGSRIMQHICALIGIQIKIDRVAEGFQIAHTSDSTGFFPGLVQRRQQHPRQDRDDRYMITLGFWILLAYSCLFFRNAFLVFRKSCWGFLNLSDQISE